MNTSKKRKWKEWKGEHAQVQLRRVATSASYHVWTKQVERETGTVVVVVAVVSVHRKPSQ